MTDELVTPVPIFRLFVTVTVHAIACPPTLSRPLHWLIAGALTPNALPLRGPMVNTNTTPSAMAKKTTTSFRLVTPAISPIEAARWALCGVAFD